MRLAAAVDVGGTGTKVGIVADDGRVVRRVTIPTPARGEPAPLVEAIAVTLRPLLDEERATVEGVGVAVAGFLDRSRIAMTGNANLPALCDFPLLPALEQRLGLPCRLEVDSNASTVAEWRFGAGRGVARLLGVTVGTGLGGGVIVDGALLRHTGECAGDIGHVVVDPGGRRCTCGARGCLEAMTCSAALAERGGGRPVRDLIRDGEPVALAALAETGTWLGLGLASLSPLFAPERIVVGGGIAAAGDALLDAVRASHRAHAAPGLAVPIAGSSFAGWEGMIGAASLLLDPMVAWTA